MLVKGATGGYELTMPTLPPQEATEGEFARAWQKILKQDPEETFYRGFRKVVNNVFTSHLPKVALGKT